MGVKGLWKLLDGTGRPVNLESLEGKVLAVDISVWLNMAIKGMRDYHGHSSQSAHLITLFNRVSKLLYCGIKPVFVFDGQAPILKQKTLRERRERKTINYRESKQASEKLLQNYLKKQLLEKVTDDNAAQEKKSDEKTADSKKPLKPSNSQNEDIYELPALSSHVVDSDEDELEEELKMRAELQREFHDNAGRVDISSVLNMDINSKDFETLPSDVQYELLQDLHEVRKRQRTRIEVMPEESNSFSRYQITGLLAKRNITKKMEEVQTKMSAERLSASHALSGVDGETMKGHIVDARPLVSDSKSHFIWMRKIKEKNEEADQTGNSGFVTEQIESNNLFHEAATLGDKSDDLEEIKPGPVSSIASDHGTSRSLKTDHMQKISVTHESSSTLQRSGADADSHPVIISLVDSDSDSPAENVKQKSGLHSPVELCKVGADADSHPAIISLVDSDSDLPAENVKQKSDPHSPVKLCKVSGANVHLAVSNKYTENDVEHPDFTADEATILKSGNVDDFVQTSITSIPSNNEERNQQSCLRTPATSDRDADVLLPQPNVSKVMLAENNETKYLKEDSEVMSNEVKVLTKIFSKDLDSSDATIQDNSQSSDDEFVEVSDLSDHQNEEATILNVDVSAIDGSENTDNGTNSQDDMEISHMNLWEGLDVNKVSQYTTEIDEQSKELRKLMQAKERAAKDLSQSAQLECQELLKLFGLPYIISPQEAEAQCAALEELNLTQGTITDDSDIWLFGGKYVIKDMFGSKSDPVAYHVSDIEMQLGLTRERFICLALCTGSDYTSGIHGVGPVTAMEILKEFEGDGMESLLKLKKWWDGVVTSPKQVKPTETKIKSQLRRVNLKKDFPSKAVFKAYMQPIVNDENKKFEWGFPDLDELRIFATGVMGWTRQKVDEVLLPLMKKLSQQRCPQTRITKFFSSNYHPVSKKKSKRVLRAAAALTGKSEIAGPTQRKRPKKVTTHKRAEKIVPEPQSLGLSESSSEDD